MSGQRHDLTHQLFIESTPLHQSLYQFLSRRYYAVLFFRRRDWSFGGRHADQETRRAGRQTGKGLLDAMPGIRAASTYGTPSRDASLGKRDARPSPAKVSPSRKQFVRYFITMSALPPAEHPNNNDQGSDANKPSSVDSTGPQPEVAEMDTTPDPPEETWEDIPEEIMELDTDDILTRIRLIDNDIKVRFPAQRCRNEITFGTCRSCVQNNCG